jgi:hypothetical protein
MAVDGSRSRIVLGAGAATLLVVGLAIGGVALGRRAPARPASAAALAKVTAAEELLLRGDSVALEKAIATLAAAATDAPETHELQARRAFATTLLAITVQDEASDAGFRAEQLNRQHRRLEPASERAAALLREAKDHEARRKVALARADKLVGESLALLKQAGASPEGALLPAFVLAQAAFFASKDDLARTEATLETLPDEQLSGPWPAWVRGFVRSRGSMSAGKAKEARAGLEAALARNPGFLRARVDLARIALALRPPELEEAARQLAAVEAGNPRHDALAPLRACLELLRAGQGAAD